MSKRGAAADNNGDINPHHESDVTAVLTKKQRVESAPATNNDTTTASTSTNPSSSPSSSSANASDDDEYDHGATLTSKVMTILFQQGILHWSAAVALGGTCKEFHQLYQTHSDELMKPLLEQLENMVESNVHQYCRKVVVPKSKKSCSCIRRSMGGKVSDIEFDFRYKDLDPRFMDCYDGWSTHMKCRKMVEFISTIVSNMRQHMSPIWDDPTHPGGHGDDFSNPHRWHMGLAQTELLRSKGKRGTLALNLAIVSLAQGGMGDDYYFDDAFLGVPNAYLGGGYAYQIRDNLYEMSPLRDQDLMTYWQESVYPSKNILELLGPVVVQKVWLSAPLFRFVPPQQQQKKKGQSSNMYQVEDLSNLPTPLEDINDGMIRRNGVGHWNSDS